MTRVGTCALCLMDNVELQESHIIPKFVVEWLKVTAATGYIRHAESPNRRRQDILTPELLCSQCEQRFSQKGESLFARHVFHPFQNVRQQEFDYEDWLLYFAISLAWRRAVIEIEDFRALLPEQALYVDIALDYWRRFLLAESNDPGPFQHHIFFLDFICGPEDAELPPYFHSYLLRGMGGTLVFVPDNGVFAYAQLPGILFWSTIYPFEAAGWKNTLISERGRMVAPQEVPGYCGTFLQGQSQIAAELMGTISDKQKAKIRQSIQNDPNRVATSRSLDVVLADMVWSTSKSRRV